MPAHKSAKMAPKKTSKTTNSKTTIKAKLKTVKPPPRVDSPKAVPPIRPDLILEVPQTVYSRSRVAKGYLPAGNPKAALRHFLGTRFCTDPEKPTLTWFAEHIAKPHGVSRTTCETWCGGDNWMMRREEYWRRVEQKLLAEIATVQIRQWSKDLEMLDGMYEQLGSQLAGKGNEIELDDEGGEATDDDKAKGAAAAHPPRKRKALIVPPLFARRVEAVRSLVEIDKRRDEKRRSVIGGLPMAVSGTAGAEIEEDALPSLTPHEARAWAHAKMLQDRTVQPVPDASTESDDEG